MNTGKAQDDHNADCVQKMRELVAQTQLEVPGVNAGVTGMPVLDYDEMVQSQKDTTVASIVSLIICALIFIYGYNETGRPIKATICLVVGLAYTLAFATITIGHLNILTVTFVPMLVGLAIDFGVHLITRYEEELRHGKSEEAGADEGDGLHGTGNFHGRIHDGGGVSGDVVHAVQGHPGNGADLRRRAGGVFHPDDDAAAGVAVARAAECDRSRERRAAASREDRELVAEAAGDGAGDHDWSCAWWRRRRSARCNSITTF